MSDYTLLILSVLAAWRVTHLLANEDGPAGIIFKARVRLGNGLVGSLMDCFNCLSFWVAAPAAFFLTSDILSWIVAWLAISGAACLLEQMTVKPIVVQRSLTALEGE
jgi:hypothetical protein